MSHGYATMSVASILAETAHRQPDNVALIFAGREIRYGELWEQTRSYAGALRDLGVEPGDKVALMLPNVPDFPRAYYAVLALGGVVVPIHALLKAEEIAYVLGDSGASVLICAAPLLAEGARGAGLAGIPTLSVLVPDEMLEQAPFPRLEDLAAGAEPIDTYVPRDPLDTATILYTSGTTGKPKGAEGCHFSLVEQVNVLLNGTLDLDPEDRILGCLPLFHTFGQTCVMNMGFRAGAAIVLVPKFDGATALQLLNEHGCTVMTGVPTMYIALLEAAKSNPDRPPLRYGMSGGAAIPVAVIERIEGGLRHRRARGLRAHRDLARRVLQPSRQPTRVGTVGTPIWGVDVEIADPEVDDRIELLPRGELGEIVVRGHNLMKGYLQPAGGERRGRGRRLVPHRRPRHEERRRLHHDRRPQEGHDRPQRLQRVPARGRGGALHASGRRHGGRLRCRATRPTGRRSWPR